MIFLYTFVPYKSLTKPLTNFVKRASFYQTKLIYLNESKVGR